MTTVEPLSKELEALVAKLTQRFNAQRVRDRRAERYYKGLQQIAHLGIAIPPEIYPFAFPLNWCRTYIDAVLERQDVRMFMRIGQTEEDEELRADWLANDLGLRSQMAHKDLLVFGRAFISVAADPKGGRPRIRVESPKHFVADVNPMTETMDAAMRVYTHQGKTLRTLYLPNETVILGNERGRWGITERVEHGLGRVPIVQMVNRQMTGDYEGETQLSDLMPIVDMTGRVMLNLQLAMEAVGTPQKVALGVTQEDFQDEDGNPLDPWETYLGAIWALSDKDAKVLQLPSGDLTGFHKTITMLAEQAATVTGLPIRMMGQNTANPAAEGSIRADEARLVKQVERINSVAGAGWAWALGIAERIRRNSWESDGQIQTIWQNPATPTESQRTDALQKATGGKPFMSVRGAMHELDWPQSRIDRELEWLREEQESPYGKTNRPFDD